MKEREDTEQLKQPSMLIDAKQKGESAKSQQRGYPIFQSIIGSQKPGRAKTYSMLPTELLQERGEGWSAP